MVYAVNFKSKVWKQLDRIPVEDKHKIILKTVELEDGEKHKFLDIKELKNNQGFRLRVGNYRIIFEKFQSELIIEIVEVGHRKDIYK